MPGERRKLIVLHTNDIHSHFEQMPKIATAIRQLKQSHPLDPVITVDIGDHMDRMRVETDGTEGQANVEVMNATGYNLAVPGNNEGLTFTMQQLEAAYSSKAKFDVLASNMGMMPSGRLPYWLKPYQIRDWFGVKVAFLGVTAYYPDFYQLLDWKLDDPLPNVARWVERLKEEADSIIVLSHLGLTNDRRMAEQISGIDLILGAHTHHLLEEPLLVENTYIGAAGKFGQYVGEMELTYDTSLKKLERVEGRVIEVDSYEEAGDVVEIIERCREQGKAYLSTTITSLDRPLTIAWRQESGLGNLLASGVRRWVDAEVGIINAGQLLGGLEEGPVTKLRLLQVCPSPINPCKFWLRGDHLALALEQSLLDEFIDKEIRGFGFRGKVLGMLCLDGIDVDYDAAAPSYHKIRQIYINGLPLEPERHYLVGSLDMFTFGVGYLSLSKGTGTEYYLPEFLREVLEHQLSIGIDWDSFSASHWREIGKKD
ncbi:bifunctional UDP-sugar hydrolase/5'-nucleotidase [Paenibacillus sp. 32O-W]|uniref:bifunctional metallophosphatase/5'-nucleotidase n=1 Tax=Paenibacillus sp. 32O-W TaxID=1695218 RepID=UPI0011A66942|nr:bifunctional UDP-sugar hydrolase/5'-nucleotidase [Paenibacillus sp. 32O-W]